MTICSHFTDGKMETERKLLLIDSLIEFIELRSDYITFLFNIVQWLSIELKMKFKLLTLNY